MSITLADVKGNNPHWFNPRNKRFFGDLSYRILHSKGKAYLVRLTNAWSDMFGQPKQPHYRINPISDQLEILPLLEGKFDTIEEVKDCLRGIL
jgi:hypothetical protein